MGGCVSKKTTYSAETIIRSTRHESRINQNTNVDYNQSSMHNVNNNVREIFLI